MNDADRAQLKLLVDNVGFDTVVSALAVISAQYQTAVTVERRRVAFWKVEKILRHTQDMIRWIVTGDA